MNAVEMEAVSPIEALRLAIDELGNAFHVYAGDDLIEFYRSSAEQLPKGARINFHVNQVPYRRGKHHRQIPPLYAGNWNPAWVSAPEEYIRCVRCATVHNYTPQKQTAIPVIRPQIL